MENIAEARKEAIQKPILLTEDIVAIFNCTPTKARMIKHEAIEKMDGAVPFNKYAVKADSVFRFIGLDRGKEIAALIQSPREPNVLKDGDGNEYPRPERDPSWNK